LPTKQFLRLETGGHTARLWRIAVDAGERFLVTASDDKTARVWDLATGKPLQILRPPIGEGNEGKLFAVAISPDGRTVAVAGWTGYEWDKSDSIYLFDWASGRLDGRLRGLPDVISHLAYSPDGRYLAAALVTGHGIRVFRTADGAEAFRGECGANSNSVEFDRQNRLLNTCLDGYLRLYDASFHLIAKQAAPGGKQPFFARFSPDGRQIAVGFDDSTAVNLLSGEDLHFLSAPDTRGVDNGDLSKIAWSADGHGLYAGGRYRDGSSWHSLSRWDMDRQGAAQVWRVSSSTIMDLRPLRDGRLAFGAADPAFGLLQRGGGKLWERRGEILDFRDEESRLRLSADGATVEFGFGVLENGSWQRRLARFDLASKRLSLDSPGLPSLDAPRVEGEARTHWLGALSPSIHGKPLTLETNEMSRSLALAPQGPGFLLGAEFSLRYYDSAQQLRWQSEIPGIAWAVNLSADGRYAVAAYGDGTIRWHEMREGKEVLALYVHPDGERWVAWTPEGFYDASPGAASLVGFHVNHGAEQAGEYVGVNQLAENFLRPDLIAQRLGPNGDRLIAEAVARRGDAGQVLAYGSPPKVELLSVEPAGGVGEFRVKVRISDQGGGIGQAKFRVDGKEIAGRMANIPMAGGDRYRLVEATLSLAGEGEHEISAEASNTRGVLSVADTRKVALQAAAPPEALHILAVGVSNYDDSDLKLKYAAADAQAVAQTLDAGGKPLFPRGVKLKVLADRDASLQNIVQTFDGMAKDFQPQDTFVLFLAGHGQTSKDGKYYFLPWEMNYKNDAALAQQALGEDRLREMMRRMPLQGLTLLDTCRSGTMVASRGVEDKGSISRLMTTSGRAIIAASKPQDLALEGVDGHGVFSYAVLQALADADFDGDGKITVAELELKVSGLVPKLTEERFHYKQNTQSELNNAHFVLTRH
jgi:WD40 repeat protein